MEISIKTKASIGYISKGINRIPLIEREKINQYFWSLDNYFQG